MSALRNMEPIVEIPQPMEAMEDSDLPATDQDAGKKMVEASNADRRVPRTRPRTMTSTEEIDSTIIRPGSVKINVTGAFIVDPDTATPAIGARNGSGMPSGSISGRHSPTHHETSDIRLPNHTAVVSHIAIDVRCGYIYFFFRLWNSTQIIL